MRAEKLNLPFELNQKIEEYAVNEISIGCSAGSVYSLKKNDDHLFLKIASSPNLSKEYIALTSLKNVLPVPECLYFINDGNKEYLLTKKVNGDMACSGENLVKEEETVRLAAKAIKLLQSVNISRVNILNNIDVKLNIAKYNIDNNLLTEAPTSKIGEELKDYNKIYEYLINNKPKEELVFSHGDLSLPNLFLKNGEITGFIDLGDCGIADKWYDIFVCHKSIIRNFPENENLPELFLQELGLENCPVIDYYSALLDLYL